MINTLRKDGIIVDKTKVVNFLKKDRSKRGGSKRLTLRDLINWAESMKAIPEDMHQVYVANYEYEIQPERSFRIFITTKTLIGFTLHVSYIIKLKISNFIG